MKRTYSTYNHKYDSTIEIKVPSELYGITDCVVSVEGYKLGRRVFPCGSGEDYKLKKADITAINELIEKSEKENI